MKEYRELFLQESTGHLNRMEELLTGSAMLAGPDLDDLFREVHSLKGMAATMGYRSFTELAHMMEDYLGALRDKGAAVDQEGASLLLRCRDRMDSMRANASEGEEQPDWSDLARLLGGLAEGPKVQAEPLKVLITIDPASPTPAARAYFILQRFKELCPGLSSIPTEAEVLSGAKTAELALLLPEVSRDDAEIVYNSLTDVAGLRFIDARPAPASPAPDCDPEPNQPPEAREGQEEFGLPDMAEVPTALLDDFLEIVGELTMLRARLTQFAQTERSTQLQDESRKLGATLRKLDGKVMTARMMPFELIAGRLRRFVRDQALSLGKEVRLEVSGERIGLDKSVMLRLSGAILHLLRNSLDHGLEYPAQRRALGKPSTGLIAISLERERNSLKLTLSDDGRGIDPASVAQRAVERGLVSEDAAARLGAAGIYEFLFEPGFSTSQTVGELSGRGVGLDAVRTTVVRMGGSVRVDTKTGRGATFVIELPVSPALAPVLLVEVGGMPLAIPVHSVRKTFEASRAELKKSADGSGFQFVRDAKMEPLRLLAAHVGSGAKLNPARFAVVSVGSEEKSAAWAVDRLVREEEIFVKPFKGPWARLRGLMGYSLLGDGRPVYLLDPADLLR